jgi:hypothetical protein
MAILGEMPLSSGKLFIRNGDKAKVVYAEQEPFIVTGTV